MAGYAAMGRVSGARVTTIARDGRASHVRAVETMPIDAATPAVIEDAWTGRLAERIWRLREALAITTFYLTDSESWR